jgi:hypothetical protein
MSYNAENMAHFERVLSDAKAGDSTAIEMVRKVMRDVGDKAPAEELISIADFTADILRRHIRDHIAKN